MQLIKLLEVLIDKANDFASSNLIESVHLTLRCLFLEKYQIVTFKKIEIEQYNNFRAKLPYLETYSASYALDRETHRKQAHV